MFKFIWNEIFFRPVFNTLIFLYNNFSYYNFGIAVIYLTIIIRVLLLPLSITTSKSREFYRLLSEKVKEIDKDYGSDYIKKREIIREYLKRNRIRPWMKTIILGSQLLILILLYQVFLGGLNARDKYASLYTFMSLPDLIPTQFLWFDLSKPNWGISFVAGFFLFIEIILSQSNKKEILSRRDQMFKIFFPLFTVAALGILPSVKSVFILTSILFSIILILVMNSVEAVFVTKKKKEETKPKIDLRDITIKRVK